jgi:hypothetical protein
MEDIPLVFTNNNNNGQNQNINLTNTSISSENTKNNFTASSTTANTHSGLLKKENQPIKNSKRSRRGDMATTNSSDLEDNDCGGGDESSGKRVNKYSSNKKPMNNRLYRSGNKTRSKLMHMCFNFNYVKNTKNDYNLLTSLTTDDESPSDKDETDQLTTQTISFETTELTNFNSSNSKRACCCCCCCFYCCCNLFNRLLAVCFK